MTSRLSQRLTVAALAEVALAAVDGRVEGDAVADGEVGNTVADRRNSACGFVAHDDGRNAAAGRAVVTVHIAAADAGMRRPESILRRGGVGREVRLLQMLVFGEQQGLHSISSFLSVLFL